MGQLIAYAAAISTAVLIYTYLIRTKAKRDRNPPGPRPLPVLGNIFDFPKEKAWEVFANMQEQYGDLVYMNVLGTRMLVLNSMSACNDLLEKRSAKYSGRPHSVMLGDMAGFDFSFDFMGYTPRWRKHRRLFHQHFNENESLKYRPVQERYVHVFLQRLLTEPEKFFSYTRSLFGETILDVIYDIKPEDNVKSFVQLVEKAVAIFLETSSGLFLVDVFPPLRHLPSWLPGASFKRQAVEWRKLGEDVRDIPFNHTKKKIEEGTAEPSVVLTMLQRCDDELDKGSAKDKEPLEEVAKNCAAVGYLAGADTTLSSVQAFFMLIANNQDVQQEAHKELDALLGDTPNRLPTYADKDQLPFTTAITKELLRWHNVVPMGGPHELTEDDEYNGYLIRKGTIVFPNVWHILRDPKVYPDPLTFNPRRWLIKTPRGWKLNPDVPEPTLTFGSGRRICPGRYFAANSLFITVVNLLTCFDIKPLDAQGQPAEHIDEVFTTGLLIYPIPFKVSITARSGHIAQLVRDLEI